MAATTGLSLASMRVICGGRNGSFMPVLNSVMSAPAEKNLPVPVSTMALTAGSAWASLKALLQVDAQRMAQRVHRRVVHAQDRHVALLLRFHDRHGRVSSGGLLVVCARPQDPAWREHGAGLLSRYKQAKARRKHKFREDMPMLRGLMMDRPLLVSSVIDYAAEVYPDVEIVSQTVEGGLHRYGYRAARERIGRLANALIGLGIKPGDRVATLAWNGYRHFELYYAIAGIGAVCHTINPRLFPEQITYIANHAEDTALFFDLTFLPLVEKLKPALKTIGTYVLMTDREHMPANGQLNGLLCYEGLLAEVDAADRMAGVRRERRLRALLHLGHHRRAQGRALLQPLDGAAHLLRHRRPARTRSRATARSCPWCRCSTPTPGACPTSRR